VSANNRDDGKDYRCFSHVQPQCPLRESGNDIGSDHDFSPIKYLQKILCFLIAARCYFGMTAAASEAPKQHKNDNDDQDRADDADTAVSVAVTVAAESAAEPA
jgi:hypothetical protein